MHKAGCSYLPPSSSSPRSSSIPPSSRAFKNEENVKRCNTWLKKPQRAVAFWGWMAQLVQAEQVWAAPKEPSERFLTCLVPNQCRSEDPKHPQGSVTGVQTPPEIPPGKAAPCCGVGAAGQRVEKTFRRMFRNTETFSTGGVELLGVWGPSRGCLWGRESLSHLPAPCSCNVWLQGPHGFLAR